VPLVQHLVLPAQVMADLKQTDSRMHSSICGCSVNQQQTQKEYTGTTWNER